MFKDIMKKRKKKTCNILKLETSPDEIEKFSISLPQKESVITIIRYYKFSTSYKIIYDSEINIELIAKAIKYFRESELFIGSFAFSVKGTLFKLPFNISEQEIIEILSVIEKDE